MNKELKYLTDQFLKILNLCSVIGRKPKDYGTEIRLSLQSVDIIDPGFNIKLPVIS
jgi:hypothetical protein